MLNFAVMLGSQSAVSFSNSVIEKKTNEEETHSYAQRIMQKSRPTKNCS